MNDGLISIIIVNWNGIKWLKDCFNSLASQTYKNFEIIFVDNASTDGSVDWVKAKYPETKIIINRINLGFADANNVGFRKSKGQYVLFLNNDTRVSNTFLIELIRAIKSDISIGGAQSKILLIDHTDTHDSVGAFLTLTGFLYHYGFGRPDESKYDKQINLYTAKGACMMFRKDVLDQIAVGGNIFDQDYFSYFEESDMCHRVWLSGYRIIYAYKSVIYHKMGATSRHMNNTFIQYHSFKNRIRTYIKNFGLGWFLTILPVHIAICKFYELLLCIRGNWALAWAIERAGWWNIMHIRKTMRLRRYIQNRIRCVSDSEISRYILKYPHLSYFSGLMTGVVRDD